MIFQCVGTDAYCARVLDTISTGILAVFAAVVLIGMLIFAASVLKK